MITIDGDHHSVETYVSAIIVTNLIAPLPGGRQPMRFPVSLAQAQCNKLPNQFQSRNGWNRIDRSYRIVFVPTCEKYVPCRRVGGLIKQDIIIVINYKNNDYRILLIVIFSGWRRIPSGVRTKNANFRIFLF